MRIVLATHDYPPLGGGISRMCAELVRHLRSRGNRVDVLAPALGANDRTDADAGDSVKRYGARLPRIGSRGNRLLQLFALRNALRHTDADVVVFAHLYQLLAADVLAARGVPYAVLLHGGESRVVLRNPLARGALRRRLASACGVIANSRYTQREFLAHGLPLQNALVVSPGVDPVPFAGVSREVARKSLGLDGKLVLLTVARLVRRKGHDMVLRALRVLRREFPEALYVVVGTGPERGRLEDLIAAHGLHDCVRLEGHVSDDQLPRYYRAADVFVMPSRLLEGDREGVEGFGIVYLEANAAGCPVVAGRSGGVADAVIDGETGLLVDPGSESALVEALRSVLSGRDLRERLGRDGCARVWREFTWERQAKAVEGILADWVGGEAK